MRNALTALLVACSCSSSVLGQDELPTFYLFQGIHVNNQVQSQPLGFESDPRMTALVAVNTASGTVDDDPVNAADKVMDFIRDRLVDPTKGYLNPADIAVSLPGFAHGQPETGADLAPNSAMRDPSDPIRPPPGGRLSWPLGFDTRTGSRDWWSYALVHPWMTASRARLRSWTQTFIARILSRHEADGIPLPRRFMFDTEQPLYNCCESAWSFNLSNVMNDPRWSSTVVLGTSPPKSMAQLLSQAQAQYGWNLRLGDHTLLNPGFNPLLFPQDMANRPLSHWYSQVTRRIRAAMMNETAYTPIRAAYDSYRRLHPAERVPFPILSNFGEYLTDGEPHVFGWFEEKLVQLDPLQLFQAEELPTYDYVTRLGRRVAIDPNNEGAKQGFTMVTRGSGFVDALERWMMLPTMTWSDRDCPALYDYRVNPTPLYSHRQRNLFLPAQPLESDWDTCMRLHRQKVESIQHSVDPQHAPVLSPYIRVPGDIGDFGVPITTDDTRRLLALLRSKRITEIVPFTERLPETSLSLWRELRSLYRQVWAFRLATYSWVKGDQVTHSSPPPTALTDTVLIPGDGELVESVTSAVSVQEAGTARTQLEAVFKPLLPVRGTALRINFESQVLPGPFNPYTSSLVEGQVWLWEAVGAGGGRWRQLAAGEGSQSPLNYAFSTYDGTTRRSFDIPAASRFISPDGGVRVMLRHIAPAEYPEDGFESRYDLVQIVLLNETVADSSPDSRKTPPCAPCFELDAKASGPDVNFDGVVDERDLSDFLSAWRSGNAVDADYNRDDEVTDEDANAFLSDYFDSLTQAAPQAQRSVRAP